jgi:porphobilinogen synthase
MKPKVTLWSKEAPMHFPRYRPRRLRANENFRRLIRETTITVNDLIYPLFVRPGKGIKNPISSMPGCYQLSVDELTKEAQEIYELGIPGIILFGIPEKKDERASEAYAADGIIQRAVQALKDAVPNLLIITDVCLCEYTSHGHCGLVKDGVILNDPTLELLARQALSHVTAGAAMVAPSDMMDGRVKAIRNLLDEEGYSHIPIMAYSAKYASTFYGPFREAAESPPQFGDRKTYQMDPANSDEAVREVDLDLEEGADIIMVKPALSYLDIIYRVKKQFNVPIAAYNVSGEYAMIKAAAQLGWIDGEGVMQEVLLSIKRAGADIILTYFAKEMARLLAK